MKKIFVALLVVSLMASVSLAAKSITSNSNGMRFGIGSYVIGAGPFGLGGGGMTLFKMVGDTFTGGVGITYQSVTANNATNSAFGLAGILTFNLTGGAVPTHAGGGLTYTSIPGGSMFTANLLYGAETMIANNLSVGFDVIPISFASQSANNANGTVMSIGLGSVYASYLF